MSRRIVLALAVLSCLPNGSPSAQEAGPAAMETVADQLKEVAGAASHPFDGISYRRFERSGGAPQVIHVLEVDLTRPGIGWTITPGDRSRGMDHVAALTTEFARRSGAAAAINSGYFLPFSGGTKGGEDYYPKVGDPVSLSGAEISEGRRVSPARIDRDLRVNAIVCFQKAQVLIRDGQVCPAGTRNGVAAGPRLLADGHVRDVTSFDNAYAVSPQPRTAIGVSADGRWAWIVVVDGRQTGYSVGATLGELTMLFLRLGAASAINLDGGGSSTMVLRSPDGLPHLVNRPIHTGVPGRERPVASQIGLFAESVVP